MFKVSNGKTGITCETCSKLQLQLQMFLFFSTEGTSLKYVCNKEMITHCHQNLR